MLIIKFSSNEFKLYYSKSNFPVEAIAIGNDIYYLDKNSKESEGFIGFFDWLRKDAENIVGIRLCFLEHQSYNHFLEQLPYVKPTFKNKYMEILFTNDSYNPGLSTDQDFTNNYVYESKTRECLFTFGVDNLTESELENLLKTNNVSQLSL